MVAVSLSMIVEVVDKGETGGRERERVPRVRGRWSSLGSPAFFFLRNLGLCSP